MDMPHFLMECAELLEQEPGTVAPENDLLSLGWDSAAVVGFLAMCDSQYGKAPSPEKIRKCVTIQDLYELVANE